MAIDQLGSGVGYIYFTNGSNITFGKVLPNTPANALKARMFGLVNSPTTGGRRATATYILDTIGGAVNLTNFTISGVSQIDVAVPVAATYTPAATDPYQTLLSVAAAINAFNPGSGPDYTAYAIEVGTSGHLIIEAPDGVTQSALNGASLSATWSVPANVTEGAKSDTIIHSGSDNTEVYDTRHFLPGTKCWLDSRTAATTTLDTNLANDISVEINLMGQNHPIDVQRITMSNNAAIFTRRKNKTILIVNGGGGNLDVISGSGIQEGDEITIMGESSGSGVVIRDFSVATASGKNIYTPGAESIPSDDATTMFTVHYVNDTTNGFGYYPKSETEPITPTTVRNGGVLTPLNQEIWEQVPAAGGGTLTITPGAAGAAPLGIHKVKLTGTVTLTGNYNVVVSTASATDGDYGIIYGDTLAITNGGGQLVIAGITIPDEIALAGNFAVIWYYGGSSPSLNAQLVIDPTISNWITTAMIGPLQVTGAEIAAATITAGKYAAGSIVTADLDPANINLNTIGLAGSISAALLDAALNAALNLGLKQTSLSISAAQIAILNGTPLPVVGAPGAGKIIEVVSAFAVYTFVTTAYITNIQLNLKTDTATQPQFICADILGEGSSALWKFTPQVVAPSNTQLIANKALYVEVNSGNPGGGGDSTVEVFVVYREVTI